MPVDPRPASTVVLLRPSAARFEVLLLRRSDSVAFMAGACVFPGGRVDDGDEGATPEERHLAAAVREVREETGIALAREQLVPFARWVTPPLEIRRYDTRFYLAIVAPDTRVTHDGVEHTATLWMEPAEALARAQRGDIALPPPTWTTLRWLAAFASPSPIEPVVEERDGVKRLTVPGERPTHFVMERGRWVAAGA